MFSSLLKKSPVKRAVQGVVLFGAVPVLLAGFFFVSCGEPGGLFDNAQKPKITAEPAAATNWDVSADTTKTLTVTANVTDGGKLTYQWYTNAVNNGGISESTAINGGTSATLTLNKADYTTNGDYYFYVIVTNTNNAVNGTKTATTISDVAKVTVLGNLTVPAALIGIWMSDWGEDFIISDTTFTSAYGGDTYYAGTIVNVRLDTGDPSCGYITIRYTVNAIKSDAVGNFYVIRYENLDSPPLKISGCSDMTGKAAQTEAEATYTGVIGAVDGYFQYHSDCTKQP